MSAPLEKLLRDARIDLILARIEKDSSVVNEVITHLDSEIRSIKFNSILVLGEVGLVPPDAIPKIMSCLEDEDWSICREATRSIGKIGSIAQDAVPPRGRFFRTRLGLSRIWYQRWKSHRKTRFGNNRADLG